MTFKGAWTWFPRPVIAMDSFYFWKLMNFLSPSHLTALHLYMSSKPSLAETSSEAISGKRSCGVRKHQFKSLREARNVQHVCSTTDTVFKLELEETMWGLHQESTLHAAYYVQVASNNLNSWKPSTSGCNYMLKRKSKNFDLTKLSYIQNYCLLYLFSSF